MIKAVIFDFFDVIRSDPYNAWLKNHGFVRENEFLKASQRLDSGQIDMNHFFKLLGSLSGQDPGSIELEFESVAKVDQEVLRIINRLKPHYSIGLLSNSPSKLIREILNNNDLEKYFDEIVISSEVGHIKPSQEIFQIILNRMGLRSSEALFIDDSEHYVKGAEKAGIKSLQFSNASQLANDLQKIGLQAIQGFDP